MISAVTGFGLFVELTDIYVEGLVHVTALPGDYYHFDPIHHRLSGERTGRSFRLGDPIEVLIARVDLDERKIDFELAENALSAPVGRKKRAPINQHPRRRSSPPRGRRPAAGAASLLRWRRRPRATPSEQVAPGVAVAPRRSKAGKVQALPRYRRRSSPRPRRCSAIPTSVAAAR